MTYHIARSSRIRLCISGLSLMGMDVKTPSHLASNHGAVVRLEQWHVYSVLACYSVELGLYSLLHVLPDFLNALLLFV